MKRISKEKVIGILASILIHALVVLLLYVLVLVRPEKQQEESTVVLGDFEAAMGEELAMTEVDVVEQTAPVPEPAEEVPSVSAPEENLVTQEQEESMPVVKKEKQPEKKVKEETDTKAKEEAERKAKAEAERKAKEEAERKAKAEAERKAKETESNVASAFKKGNSAFGGGGTETDGKKVGLPDGNSSIGISANVKGRTPRSLASPPKRAKNVEGIIVVDVTVEPDGTVKNPIINRGKTTISDNILRNEALKAAANSRFDVIPGVDQSVGTITYRYTLK